MESTVLETTVEKYLTRLVEDAGGLCEKHVSPGRRGVPDRLITWPWGEMQLVETKKPDGTVEEHQKRDHKRRRDRHVTVVVLSTKEHVKEWVIGRLVENTRLVSLSPHA